MNGVIPNASVTTVTDGTVTPSINQSISLSHKLQPLHQQVFRFLSASRPQSLLAVLFTQQPTHTVVPFYCYPPWCYSSIRLLLPQVLVFFSRFVCCRQPFLFDFFLFFFSLFLFFYFFLLRLLFACSSLFSSCFSVQSLISYSRVFVIPSYTTITALLYIPVLVIHLGKPAFIKLVAFPSHTQPFFKPFPALPSRAFSSLQTCCFPLVCLVI